jgi:hypothetical protein
MSGLIKYLEFYASYADNRAIARVSSGVRCDFLEADLTRARLNRVTV